VLLSVLMDVVGRADLANHTAKESA
jgi:hypothetical protein